MQKMVRTKVKGDTACSDDRKEPNFYMSANNFQSVGSLLKNEEPVRSDRRFEPSKHQSVQEYPASTQHTSSQQVGNFVNGIYLLNSTNTEFSMKNAQEICQLQEVENKSNIKSTGGSPSQFPNVWPSSYVRYFYLRRVECAGPRRA